MGLPERVVEATGQWGVEPPEREVLPETGGRWGVELPVRVVTPELTTGLLLKRRETLASTDWLTEDVYYTSREEGCPGEHCSTQPQMTWVGQLRKWVWYSQQTENCWLSFPLLVIEQ